MPLSETPSLCTIKLIQEESYTNHKEYTTHEINSIEDAAPLVKCSIKYKLRLLQ
jgi:hypothetical protein